MTDKKAKIEIGEYVRTKDGIIGKFEKYDNYECHIRIDVDDVWKCGIDQIKSHSDDLIDLIEIGDIVNEKYVAKIKPYKDEKSILALVEIIDEQNIKSVLTHEQYERECFRKE